MLATARVERGVAGGAGVVGVQVVGDREFGPADATEHGGVVEPVGGPAVGVVVGDRAVTPEAGVVVATAGEPDGDDVALAVVVGTPRLGADGDTPDDDALDVPRTDVPHTQVPRVGVSRCHGSIVGGLVDVASGRRWVGRHDGDRGATVGDRVAHPSPAAVSHSVAAVDGRP